MKKTMFLICTIIVLALSSCSKEDDPTPTNNNCNTEDMSFESDILPIFNSSCNGCHSSAAKLGGIALDNFADVKSVVNQERLLGSIKRSQGFSPMPQGGDKLASCTIDKVEAWIADGANDN